MQSIILRKQIEQQLKFSPTQDQSKAIEALSEYIGDNSSRGIMVLKGFAGTGKTTLMSALVKSLSSVNKKSCLLAPTGRAAKVLGQYSNRRAFTIHKKIYWINTNSKGNTYLKLQENKQSNTVFIVDEASMIPNREDKGFGNRILLDDLIEFVFDGVNCKLILIGDTAQLPPVGLDLSPALNTRLLESHYNKEIIASELSQVLRQSEQSNILFNATLIRQRIFEESPNYPKLHIKGDVHYISNGEALQFALEEAYNTVGFDQSIIICRSNKRAFLYNKQVRFKIRWFEDEISSGDYLMIVRNNYSWLPPKSKVGFLANGDTMEVQQVFDIEEKHGFRFARVEALLVDYPDEPPIEVLILLDTISSELPSLSYDDYKKLYNSVSLEYVHIKNTSLRNRAIKEDEYFNAVQVKFAYAITCHKSQGGQWEHVFIEQGFFQDNMLDKAYLRWLYTALSRAKSKLYLIGFKEAFIKDYNNLY